MGVPAIYYLPEFARAGGLMAYGNSLPDIFRLVGIYVGRILKGEKPADLPVVQLTTATTRFMGLSRLYKEDPTVRPTGRLGSRGRKARGGPKDAPVSRALRGIASRVRSWDEPDTTGWENDVNDPSATSANHSTAVP